MAALPFLEAHVVKKKGDYQIPFDKDGNMLEYGGGQTHVDRRVAEFRPNKEFSAWLKIVDMERGRSAARFILRDVQTGVRYVMFLTDAVDLLRQPRNVVRNSIHKGRWGFVKRGSNFGIRLVIHHSITPWEDFFYHVISDLESYYNDYKRKHKKYPKISMTQLCKILSCEAHHITKAFKLYDDGEFQIVDEENMVILSNPNSCWECWDKLFVVRKMVTHVQ